MLLDRSNPGEADEKQPKDKPKKDEDSSPGEFLEEDEPAQPERKKRKKAKPGDIRTPDGALARGGRAVNVGAVAETLPRVGFHSPAATRSRLDLPVPFAPTMPVFSP